MQPAVKKVTKLNFKFSSYTKCGHLSIFIMLLYTLCLYYKSFKKQDTLRRHISIVHEGAKPFQCDICDSTFTEKSKLKRHVASVHDRKKTSVLFVGRQWIQTKSWYTYDFNSWKFYLNNKLTSKNSHRKEAIIESCD